MESEDILEKNYLTYKKYLTNLVGELVTDGIIEVLGGEEKLKRASFGMTSDSGSAYDGSLVENTIKIADYASKINQLLPENIRVQNSEIYKVALLSHISKVLMYTKNTNDWEIKNRGMLYKFVEAETYLKSGERSVLIAMNSGVRFTDSEYEAMRIIDRIKENDGMNMWYAAGTLSTVIRQANELVALENKKNK